MADNDFEEITGILNSMRAQNAINAGDMEKVLSNINYKLENLASEDNTDLIKVFLAELKKNLDERHNFVSDKFAQIENSVSVLRERNQESLKSSEIRELFDIIATNLNVFSKEVVAQKDTLNEITERIENIRNDDSQKRDILRNISVLKLDLEKFNNGFESIVVNVNDNFKIVSQSLAKIDATDKLEVMRRDLENIFLSSNAVLSALQVIDHKNRDLEQVITNLVTKEDFELSKGLISRLIASSEELGAYVDTLPRQSDINGLAEKVDTSVGVIAGLKTVLTQTGEHNNNLLLEQLGKLEDTVKKILTEEDFMRFRVELQNLVSEVIQGTNLMRGDLLETNSDLKNVLIMLTSLDIKTNFQKVFDSINSTEDGIKTRIYELSDTVVRTSQINSDRTISDINSNIVGLSQKLDVVSSNIIDTEKLTLEEMNNTIAALIGTISAVKNDVHTDNLQNINVIDEKLLSVKEELIVSRDSLSHKAQQNVDSIISNISNVISEIASSRENFDRTSQANSDGILSSINDLCDKLYAVQNDLKQSAESNVNTISNNFYDLSNKLGSVDEGLRQIFDEKIANIMSNVVSLSEKLNFVNDDLKHSFFENISRLSDDSLNISNRVGAVEEGIANVVNESSARIFADIHEVSEHLGTLDVNLKQAFDASVSGIISDINSVSENLVNLENNIKSNADMNFSRVSSDMNSFTEKFGSLETNLKQSVDGGVGRISSDVRSISEQFGVLEVDLKENAQGNVERITAQISEIRGRFDELTEEFKRYSDVNTQNILSNVGDISEKFEGVNANINRATQVNIDSVRANLEEVYAKFDGVYENINRVPSATFELLKDNAEALSQKLESIKENLNNNNQSNYGNLNDNLNNIVQRLNGLNDELNNKADINAASVNSTLEELSQKVDGSIVEFIRTSRGSSELVKTNIDELSQKVDSVVAEFENISRNGTESVNSNFGELSQKVDNVVVEFNNTAHSNVETLRNNIDELSQKVDGSIVEFVRTSRGSSELVKTNMDELSQKVDNVVVEFNNTAHSNVEALRNNINELSQKIENSKEVLSQNSQENYQSLNTGIVELSEKLSDVGGKFDEYSSENFENIIANIDEIAKKIDWANSNINVDFTNNIVRLKEIIILLPETIRENQLALDNENKMLIEQNTKSILEIVESVNNLSVGIMAKDAPMREKIETEISSLKDAISSLGGDLKNSDNSISEDLTNKLSHVEQMISQSSETYEGGLYNLQNKLTEYLQNIQQASEEAYGKVNNSMAEVNDIKSELQSVVNNINDINLNQNDRFNGLSQSIQGSFEDIIENISGLAKLSQNKDDDGLKNALQVLDGKLENVLSNLDEHKTHNYNDTQNVINVLEEKTSGVKQQLSLINTDIIDAVNDKTQVVLTGFDSVKESIDRLLSIDFNKISADVKTQLELANLTLGSLVKDNVQEENQKIIDNLGVSFSEFNNRINGVGQELLAKSSNNLDELKSILENVLNSVNIKPQDNSDRIIEEVIASIESISKSNKENILSAILVNTDSINTLNTELSEKISSTQSLIREQNANQMLSFKSEMVTLAEEVSKIQSAVKSYRDSIPKIEKTDDGDLHVNFDSLERNIVEQFAENVDKFRASVSMSAEQIEAKISLSETHYAESAKNFMSDIRASFYDKVEESIDELKSFLEVLNNRNDATLDIDNLKSDMLDRFSDVQYSLEDVVSKINFKDEAADLSQEITNSLKESLDGCFERLVQTVQESSNNTELLDKDSEILKSIDNLKTSLSEEIFERTETFTINLENQKDNFSNIKDDIKKAIEEMSQSFNDLSINSNMEISVALANLDSSVGNLKSEIVFPDNSQEIISEISDLKKNFIDLSLNSSAELASSLSEIQEKFASMKKSFDGLDFDMIMETHKNQIIEEIKNIKVETPSLKFDDGKINEALEVINQKIDLLALTEDTNEVDFSDDINEIKALVAKQNKALEALQSLKSLDNLDKLDKLDDLSCLEDMSKLDNLSKLDGLETIKSEIKAGLLEIENKIDNIEVADDNSQEIVEDIKNELISVKSSLVETLMGVFEQISFVVEAEEIKDFVEEKTEELKSELQELKKSLTDKKKVEIADYTDEFVSLTELILEKDKSEDIKSLNENIDDSFEKILSSLDMLHDKTNEIGKIDFDFEEKDYSDEFDNILNGLEQLGDKTNSVDHNCDDIKKNINELKKQIREIQSNDDSDYNYTLQDVESDIAKLRLALTEITKNTSNDELDAISRNINELAIGIDNLESSLTQEEISELKDNVEKLQGDIVSISTRTNKLLLTSDESYKTLQESLSDFRGVVFQLDERTRQLDNTDATRRLEKKLDNVNSLVMSGIKADKVLNEAFMYLAEWIDNAGENLSTISEQVEKISEIDEVKKSINDLKASMPDNDSVLNSLEEKFAKQQSRIDSLEEKLEKVLDFVNSKDNAKLTKKVDNIDKVLAKLSKNIEKLASYVDEE